MFSWICSSNFGLASSLDKQIQENLIIRTVWTTLSEIFFNISTIYEDMYKNVRYCMKWVNVKKQTDLSIVSSSHSLYPIYLLHSEGTFCGHLLHIFKVVLIMPFWIKWVQTTMVKSQWFLNFLSNHALVRQPRPALTEDSRTIDFGCQLAQSGWG